MSSQKKKTTTELPKLKRNKVLSTWDRANRENFLHGHERSHIRIIFIYIYSSTDKSVSSYQNSSVWLDIAEIETRLTQTPMQSL